MAAVQNIVDTRQQDTGNVSDKTGGKSYGNDLIPFLKMDQQNDKQGCYGGSRVCQKPGTD